MLMVDIYTVYWDNKEYMVIRDQEQSYDLEKTVNPWWFAVSEDTVPRTVPLHKALTKYSYRLVADTIVNISSTPFEITRDWKNNEDYLTFDFSKIGKKVLKDLKIIERCIERAEPPMILELAQLLRISLQ